MPQYFLGVALAFVEPIMHGWANIFDSYFSSTVFKRLTPFIFLSASIDMVSMSVIWLIDPPKMLTQELFIVVLLIAITEILYHYPYYEALRIEDTSIVAGLFNLGKLFLPVVAYFLVDERLSWLQYAGFFAIILSSILLTADLRKMRLNRAFFLMFVSSFFVTAQTLLFKYGFENGLTWGSAIVWMTVFQFLIAGALVLTPKNRAALKESVRELKGSWKMFIALDIIGWIGNIASYAAILFIPVSVAKAIASMQPLFPLAYALMFEKKWPHIFHEFVDRKDVEKKVILFAVMIVGVILVADLETLVFGA
jgi:drug/metabolite transporter (DMT)-like permease